MNKVSSVTFQYVLKAIEMKTNISILEMLEFADIKPEQLESHKSGIESQKLSQIFQYCMQKSGNDHLALDIGQSISYHSLGILGYLLLNTTTLKQMIEKFNYYQKLVSRHLKFHFSEDEVYYKFAIYINENRYIPVPSFHAVVHLSAIVNILTQILGQKVTPDMTHFTQDVIKNDERYREFFGSNIKYNQNENIIFFDKSKLDIPVNNSNPSMLAYFEAQADKILDELENSSWYSKVEKEILKNIGDNVITIEFVASNLGLSVRTLQNYLKSESKKFSEALMNVRKHLANHYMKNTNIDDTTISILLGYSEVSAFYRAYKNWNNCTPKERRLNKK